METRHLLQCQVDSDDNGHWSKGKFARTSYLLKVQVETYKV